MLLHFKKSNEILETWSPHCKNLAFKDPPSLNFHNRTDATRYLQYEKKKFLIFGHPGVPGEPPENEQNPYI